MLRFSFMCGVFFKTHVFEFSISLLLNVFWLRLKKSETVFPHCSQNGRTSVKKNSCVVMRKIISLLTTPVRWMTIKYASPFTHRICGHSKVPLLWCWMKVFIGVPYTLVDIRLILLASTWGTHTALSHLTSCLQGEEMFPGGKAQTIQRNRIRYESKGQHKMAHTSSRCEHLLL